MPSNTWKSGMTFPKSQIFPAPFGVPLDVKATIGNPKATVPPAKADTFGTYSYPKVKVADESVSILSNCSNCKLAIYSSELKPLSGTATEPGAPVGEVPLLLTKIK